MKKITFLFVLAAACFIGCSDDDDNNSGTASPLLQNWTLVNSGGGFAGTNYDFEKGLITWQFRANGSVKIVNNNTDQQKADGLDSGTYSYTITANTSQIQDCAESMKINEYVFYCYDIDASGKLILDDSPVDGIKLTFVKAN